PGLRGDPFTPSVIDAATTSQLPLLINFGSTGPATKLVCGFLACDAQPFNPLLENLPPVIKAGDRNNTDTGCPRAGRHRCGGGSCCNPELDDPRTSSCIARPGCSEASRWLTPLIADNKRTTASVLQS